MTKITKVRDPFDPEGAIQNAVMSEIKHRGAKDVFAFHVPNSGRRRGKSGRILKYRGLVKGVPDIIAVKDGQCFALELKALSGKVSDDQKIVIGKLEAAGAITGVTYGLYEALRWLEDKGILKGEVA